jgi:peptidoglycan/xylan/chitin deacetylase (PgdA/CDA1 family)
MIQLYLTVDDGPNKQTAAIADYLSQRGIRAVFYLTGGAIECFSNVARKVSDYGHEIGNHGYTHQCLYSKSIKEIEQELTDTQNIIQSTAGQLPTKFRPPYLRWNEEHNHLLQKLGLQIEELCMGIGDATKEYRIDYELAERNLFKKIEETKVVLIHSRQHTLEGLQDLLSWFESKGYIFVD